MRLYTLPLCVLLLSSCGPSKPPLSRQADPTRAVAGRFVDVSALSAEAGFDAAAVSRVVPFVSRFGACGAVLVQGGFLVTARHCSGQPLPPGLAKTSLSDHDEPYDLSVYRPEKPGEGVPLRAGPLQNGEPVFAVFYYQASKNDAPRLRATAGRVVDANAGSRSFCAFTNEDDVARPEDWTLESDCSRVERSRLPYKAREERDPLLTDTAMTFGMSGSPLFDAQGRLIGIGSNVLSSKPLEYDPKKPAVYVKAASLDQLLSRIR